MLTPPEIARRYKVSPDKVLHWIRGGELRAINIASIPGGRPRYAVHEADLAAFEERRQVQPHVNRTRVTRKRRDADVIEFF
jgi:hypothetical protein